MSTLLQTFVTTVLLKPQDTHTASHSVCRTASESAQHQHHEQQDAHASPPDVAKPQPATDSGLTHPWHRSTTLHQQRKHEAITMVTSACFKTLKTVSITYAIIQVNRVSLLRPDMHLATKYKVRGVLGHAIQRIVAVHYTPVV